MNAFGMEQTATPLSTPATSPCGTKFNTYSHIFFANFKEQQEKHQSEQANSKVNNNNNNNMTTAMDDIQQQGDLSNGNDNDFMPLTDTHNRIRITENPLPDPVAC